MYLVIIGKPIFAGLCRSTFSEVPAIPAAQANTISAGEVGNQSVIDTSRGITDDASSCREMKKQKGLTGWDPDMAVRRLCSQNEILVTYGGSNGQIADGGQEDSH